MQPRLDLARTIWKALKRIALQLDAQPRRLPFAAGAAATKVTLNDQPISHTVRADGVGLPTVTLGAGATLRVNSPQLQMAQMTDIAAL